MGNGWNDDMPDWAPPLEDYEVDPADAPAPDSTEAPAEQGSDGADDSAEESDSDDG